jgi:hypothetical protein
MFAGSDDRAQLTVLFCLRMVDHFVNSRQTFPYKSRKELPVTRDLREMQEPMGSAALKIAEGIAAV